MEHSRVQRDTTHEVTMKLDGVEERLDTGFGSTFQIRPRTLKLTWFLMPEPTEGWILQEAKVIGPNMLSSGLPGKRVGSRDFERDHRLTDDAPSWLVELEEQHRPSGQVT